MLRWLLFMLMPLMATAAEPIPTSLGPFTLGMKRSAIELPLNCPEDLPGQCASTANGATYDLIIENGQVQSISTVFHSGGRELFRELAGRYGRPMEDESMAADQFSAVYRFIWYEYNTQPHRLLLVSWREGTDYRGIAYPTEAGVVLQKN